MLSKKDHKAIAEIIKEQTELLLNCKDPHSQFAKGISTTKSTISRALANYFENDNPRFDRQEFYDACFQD